MTTAAELAQSQIEKLDAELLQLSEQITEKRRLKDAWELILKSQAETPQVVAALTASAKKPLRPSGTTEDKIEATKSYGEKTNSLRRMIVDAGMFGMTRNQIVTASKKLSAHPNFAYRFITRMVEAKELNQVGNSFIATDKMRDRLRPVAA
jgi:hypothetical protein